MKDDVFSFDDFFKNPKKSELVKESIQEEQSIENPDEHSSIEDVQEEVQEVQEEYLETNESSSDDDYYNVFMDKNEEFSCDIAIEGAKKDETSVRLVIESDDWTLMFNGEIRNGKCYIPIKKLSILTEGQVGNIRLEVIAEGNLFTPWEDKFKVKLSKKVTVKVNEQKGNSKVLDKNKVGVKVNVKK